MGSVTVGIDVGQKRDPTALAVVELEWREVGGRPEWHYIARHLQRLPLGTDYPAVADRVGTIIASIRKTTGSRPNCTYVDATGVGAPIFDLLQASGVDAIPVYFTHGDRRTQGADEFGRPTVTLGKAYLCSRLQVLLQSRRVHLPNTAEARALAEELLDYEIRIDVDANDRYGAFRIGTHDDLVTALGLAVQVEPHVVARLEKAGPSANKPPLEERWRQRAERRARRAAVLGRR